jgi:hypothetical protein
MAELQKLVEAEMQRRRAECIQEMEAIAATYGMTLADFINRRARDGSKRATVKQMLRAGLSAEEIAKAIGWKNTGGVYTAARSLGIQMKGGKAVLH